MDFLSFGFPVLLRAHKRESLLAATERSLEKVRASVAGRVRGEDPIGVRVGRVVNQYKMAKHFVLDIGADIFHFTHDDEGIAAQAALDGLYVTRTSLPAQKADDAQCVHYYKQLAAVERGFRSLKTVDLHVRPIHHRLAERVRAHIFVCLLAYYVEWHLREAWRELLFAGDNLAAKASGDPIAPAKRSAAAQRKASHSHARRRQPGAQLPDPAQRAVDPRTQHRARPVPAPMRRPSS